jgi:hypothetical protein
MLGIGDREGMYAFHQLWSGLASTGDDDPEPEVGSE